MSVTEINKQAATVARRLVTKIFNAISIEWDNGDWKRAKSAAIICQREMLKVYKDSGDGRHYYDDNYLAVLKALPKAINNLKRDFDEDRA